MATGYDASQARSLEQMAQDSRASVGALNEIAAHLDELESTLSDTDLWEQHPLRDYDEDSPIMRLVVALERIADHFDPHYNDRT